MWGSYTASNPNLTIERYDRLRWRRNIIIILVALGMVTIAIFAGLTIAYRDRRPWTNYEKIDDENDYFCESYRERGFLRLPSNAWFTLPLLAVSGFVAYGGLHDLLLIESRANSIVASPVVSLIHALFLFAAFVTSFVAYACGCKGWFFAAVGLQNATIAWGTVYTILTVVNAKSGWNLRPAIVAIAEVLLLPIFAAVAIATYDVLQPFLVVILGVSLMVVYIVERENVQKSLYYVSAIAIALAVIVWVIDVIEVSCGPHSGFQWHSIWTVLLSIVLATSYAFLRSENYRTSLQPYTVL